jgi:hypothetical protein
MANARLNDEREVGAWASLLMRLAIAALFLAAAVPKFSEGRKGLDNIVHYFQTSFEKTWLPKPLVTLQARLTPFIEALIVVWLITGWRLMTGWVVTSIFLISLAFGMAVAGKGDVAAHNFVYVLMAVAGLYLSRFDRFNVDSLGRGRS